MTRNGFRRTALSRYTEIDAGNELRLPIKPFLAILSVGSNYVFLVLQKNRLINTCSSGISSILLCLLK